MTIATDYEAYKMATKKLTVTSTSTAITGSGGLAAEDIPGQVAHMAIQPSEGKIYWNFGTASSATALIPADGIVFNAPSAPALRGIQLYSPTGATALVTFGGIGGRVVLGGGDVESYDVGEPFTVFIDDSALGTGLTDPAPAATKVESIGAATHGVIDTRGKPIARIMFGGNDAADEVFNYQVIAWSQAVGLATEGWIPRVIAKGAVTLGADVYAVAGVGATTNLFADTITDTILDRATVYTVADQRAVLEVPTYGAQRIEVQTDLTTAAKADAFIQFDDASAGGSVGGGAMFYEDEAHVSGDTGRMFLCVRTDTRASLAGTTGDYAPPQLNANGEMRVTDDDAKQPANTAYVAADNLIPIGGVKSATRHTAAELETFADDDWVPVGVTDVHELRTRDDDGNTLLGTIDADTDAIKTASEAATQAANTAYAAADKVTPLGGVKSATRHTAAELETFADDDYVPVGVTDVHELRVRDDDANTVLGTMDADTGNIADDVAQTNIFTATGKSITDMEYVSVVQAGAGVTAIHADESGHHFYLLGYQGTMTAAGTIQFREADDTPVYDGAMNLGANGGFGLPVTGFPLCVTASGKGLELVSVGGGFNGMVQFLDITE